MPEVAVKLQRKLPARAKVPHWEHDVALALAAARELAQALRESISSRGLARNWLARTDLPGAHQGAAAFLRDTAVGQATGSVLTEVLNRLWARGYHLGRRSAAELLDQPLSRHDAEELADVLERGAEERVPGMVATRLGRLGTVLREAPEDITAEELEAELEDELGDTTSSLMVTQTETTWSLAEGMLGYYAQAGTQTVAWLTAADERVCYVCDLNQDDGFIALGLAFSGSGDDQPPAHPLCRCALVPGDVLGAPLPISSF
jgi:hypothetical protein